MELQCTHELHVNISQTVNEKHNNYYKQVAKKLYNHSAVVHVLF